MPSRACPAHQDLARRTKPKLHRLFQRPLVELRHPAQGLKPGAMDDHAFWEFSVFSLRVPTSVGKKGRLRSPLLVFGGSLGLV